jgi:uncharacterized protein YozE (UPF0346 family)
MNFFLLQVKTNNVIAETASAVDSASFPIWFWIALIEFAIIVFLVFRLRKKREKLTFGDLSKDRIRNAKKSDVDMENLMNSINGSKELYKQLSRTCHPDRFINNNKQELAEEIFQEISKHKRDFKKLTELKEKAITELNIKFK